MREIDFKEIYNSRYYPLTSDINHNEVYILYSSESDVAELAANNDSDKAAEEASSWLQDVIDSALPADSDLAASAAAEDTDAAAATAEDADAAAAAAAADAMQGQEWSHSSRCNCMLY